MTAAPTSDTADWARPLYERQIAMAGDLAEAGFEMAMELRDRTKGQVDERACLDFARISRAVRLTLMLQARLINDLEDRDRQAVSRAKSDRLNRTRDRKERVTRIVEHVAEQDGRHPDQAERLAFEAAERLDREELYGDVLDRPASELVAMICKDLGLDPDWSRLAQEAWAKAEMAGGDVGWPFADLSRAGRSPPFVIPEVPKGLSGTQRLQCSEEDETGLPARSPGSRLSAPPRPG